MSINPADMSRAALIREVLASRSAARAAPDLSTPTGGAAARPPVMTEVREAPRRKESPEDRLRHTELNSEIALRRRALKAFTDKILRDLKQKKPRDLAAIDERNRLLIELQRLGTTLDALGRSPEPALR